LISKTEQNIQLSDRTTHFHPALGDGCPLLPEA